MKHNTSGVNFFDRKVVIEKKDRESRHCAKMSKKSSNLFAYNAPQYVELGADDPSDLENYFNPDNIDTFNSFPAAFDKIARDHSTETKISRIPENPPTFTPKNPTVDKLKASYRATTNRTPSSGPPSGVCSPATFPESPGLEYAKPWLNGTKDSLVHAMSMLEIRSANATGRRSASPGYPDAASLWTMTTSTPFVAIGKKSSSRTATSAVADRDYDGDETIGEPEVDEKTSFVVDDGKNSFVRKYGDDEKICETAGQSRDVILPSIVISVAGEVVEGPTNDSKSDDRNSAIDEGIPKEATSVNELPVDDRNCEINFVKAKTRLKKDVEPLSSTAKSAKTNSSKRRVFTSQVRRQSLKYRRRSGQYVSMAEAIMKFERATPKRFRSTANKGTKPIAARPVVRSSRKATRPESPNLRCKSRVRVASATKPDEMKVAKADETRKNRVVSNSPKLKKMTDKSPTITEKLTEITDKSPTVTDKSPTITNKSPKITKVSPIPENLQKSDHRSPAKARSMKNPENTTSNARNSQSSIYKRMRTKKTVTSVVSTETGPELKQVRIYNFGIPATGTIRKVTRTVPFNFDAASKDNRSNRDETAKKIGRSSSKPTATTSSTSIAESKPGTSGQQQRTTNSISISALGFQERNNLLLKKRKEFEKAQIEKEKQLRIFHARPAPIFKVPTTVVGSSAENFRDEVNHRTRVATPLNANPNVVDDRENRSPNVRSAVRTTTRTEERLKKRREFDAEKRRKDENEENRLRREEIERSRALKQEETELRRSMQPKATPMPIFKPPKIVKSHRPLTQPHTPLCLRRTKNKENQRSPIC